MDTIKDKLNFDETEAAGYDAVDGLGAVTTSMHEFLLDPELGGARSLLLVGAHADDIEIGCGGTALRLVETIPGRRVHWVVFTSDATRFEEARSAARAFLTGAAKATIVIKDFRDGYLPYAVARSRSSSRS